MMKPTTYHMRDDMQGVYFASFVAIAVLALFSLIVVIGSLWQSGTPAMVGMGIGLIGFAVYDMSVHPEDRARRLNAWLDTGGRFRVKRMPLVRVSCPRPPSPQPFPSGKGRLAGVHA